MIRISEAYVDSAQRSGGQKTVQSDHEPPKATCPRTTGRPYQENRADVIEGIYPPISRRAAVVERIKRDSTTPASSRRCRQATSCAPP
ncbi:hypothetical protein [Kibdelosporangium philippinense]|uniref:hypothetical protein n=1 Tax=Kibdelosporangium philippinense TaxID=211113 RepID=UPI00361825A0